MQRDPKAWLWDVKDAARSILEFVAGFDADRYAATELVHSAVERKFEIIGEALNQLSKSSPDLAARIPHLRQIVGFRNQLIHGYALIDHRTVWGVVHSSLPSLQSAVDEVLRELDPTQGGF